MLSPRKKENIKVYTVVAFGRPAFFLDPFFANILLHFCANLRWIFINMVMINLVTTTTFISTTNKDIVQEEAL